MTSKWKSSVSAAAIMVAAGITTTALPTTAQAADLYTKAPAPVVMPTTWAGFYVGLHAGAGAANWGGVFDPLDTSSAVFAKDIENDGAFGGFHLGYNWQFNNMIVGIEGDMAFMDWDGIAYAATDSEQMTGKIDSLASVRARIGVAVGAEQKALLFASLGVAWADAEGTVYPSGQASSTASFAYSFDDVGGVVGVGFEYAMTENFRLRTDLNYYWFDQSADLSAPHFAESPGSERPPGELKFEDALTVRIGATWYFSGYGSPLAAR